MKKYTYCFLFAITGILLAVYSLTVKYKLDNKNLGPRFSAGDFYESDLYLVLGFVGILFALVYAMFYRINKIQLNEKLVARHYWFSLPLLILLALLPVLDKYFPTDRYRGTVLDHLFSAVTPISFFTFIASIFFVLKNFIRSTYVYFSIKST